MCRRLRFTLDAHPRSTLTHQSEPLFGRGRGVLFIARTFLCFPLPVLEGTGQYNTHALRPQDGYSDVRANEKRR